MTEIMPPIITAVQQNDIKTVENLLKNTQEINAHYGADGKTALMACAEFCKNDATLMNLILSHTTDIDKRDKNGNTAIMHAVKSNNILATKALIENGAKTYLLNHNNLTAIDLTKNKEILSVLGIKPEKIAKAKTEYQSYKNELLKHRSIGL